MEMTTLRTHFTFRVDTWTLDGESIVEHVAGVEIEDSRRGKPWDAIRQIGVREVTYYRWRQEFGGRR
jgi:hypothetical protein